MSRFLRLHKLPWEVRATISSYLVWGDAEVLGYRPVGFGPHMLWMPLMTVSEFLRVTGIMGLLMLDRSVEEFIRFELLLVSKFTPYHQLDTTDVFLGRRVIRRVELHDFLVCLEQDNMIWVREVFQPNRYGKHGYPVSANRILQREPTWIVERPLVPPPVGREAEAREWTRQKIRAVPQLQAIIRGHWARSKVWKKRREQPVVPSFEEVPRSPGERYI